MPHLVKDRRVFPRYPLVLAAEVIERDTGTRLTSRTSDISRSGCYIDTVNPMPAGTPVRVLLTHEDETVELSAQIVYVSPGLGMGIRFENPIPLKYLAVLDRWLEDVARSES